MVGTGVWEKGRIQTETSKELLSNPFLHSSSIAVQMKAHRKQGK